MQQTDRTDQTDPTHSIMTLNIPHYGIDLRVILSALKNELPKRKIHFAPSFSERDDVIIPTLMRRFHTTPINGYLVVLYKRRIKIQMEMDGLNLSQKTIDVLVDYLERLEINHFKF
jgi:hypothetical protein